jgi:hypothetical protein
MPLVSRTNGETNGNPAAHARIDASLLAAQAGARRRARPFAAENSPPDCFRPAVAGPRLTPPDTLRAPDHP